MMDRQWMGRMLSYAHKEKLWRREAVSWPLYQAVRTLWGFFFFSIPSVKRKA